MKEKANLVIMGNLITEKKITYNLGGGGKNRPHVIVKANLEDYECNEAITLVGDIHVDTAALGGIVLITGSLISKC